MTICSQTNVQGGTSRRASFASTATPVCLLPTSNTRPLPLQHIGPMGDNLLKTESGVARDRTGVVGLNTQTDVLHAMVQQRLAEPSAHRTTQATPTPARMRGDIAQGRHVVSRCTPMHTGHTDDGGPVADAIVPAGLD